jgi:CubicO group peptidase (beta-lactamase class C family)
MRLESQLPCAIVTDALWSGDRWQKRLRAAGVNSLVVMHGGQTECSWFRRHDDEDRTVKVNSVTKSITGALAGLTGVDLETSVLSHFPRLPVDDERKRAITVEHLLAMTSGLEWPEFGEWNGAAPPMTASKDLLRAITARPLIAEPGKSMWYSTGSSHLLGAVLHQHTGLSVEQLAEHHLFRPLKIRQWQFYSDRHGYSHAGNGLRLRPTDLARIGSALLQGNLVPLEWLRECWRPRTQTYPWIGAYGWHWWVDSDLDMVFALGMGGYLLALFPRQDLVIVMTAGNANGDSLGGLRLLRTACHDGTDHRDKS